jgi:hypothetical protein
MSLKHDTPTLSREAQAALSARLPDAQWEYDEDADEMEVRLAGTAHRDGYYALLHNDLYVRLDAETDEPLGIMIPAFQLWLGRHLTAQGRAEAGATPRAETGNPARWIAEQAQAVPQALARELAGVTG